MKSKRRSQAELIELFQAVQREIGRSPGNDVFAKRTGVKISEIVYHWANYSNFVKAAGGISNTPTARLDDGDVFSDFADICLRLGKIPSSTELRIETRKFGTKTS